jgi:Piezo non-specific cation channel, R-Ras-binding domain
MIFYNLPFLLELKTVLDWCFTKTSLDVFQWLELAEINNQMFNATNGNPGLYKRRLGTKVTGFEKRFCGSICVSLMLFFLVGPFLFFSNLRYIAADNPVLDAAIGVKVKITNATSFPPEMHEFPLYKTKSPVSIFPMDEDRFKQKKYDERPETKFFDVSQVQIIRMKSQSDEVWGASNQYKLLFRDLLAQASLTPHLISVEAILDYEFFRNMPEANKKAYGTIPVTLKDQEGDTELGYLKQFK